MDEFPFTKAEWEQVNAAVLDVANASLADDDVLQASCFLTAQEVLRSLRQKYGDHPVLLETEADISDENADRVVLYESAVRIATAHSLPTLSIRISFAGLLLEMGRPDEARRELLACEGELSGSDEYERTQWVSLMDETRKP
jgi:hypothetical protein